MEARSQGDENVFQGEAGRLVLEAFSKLFYAAMLSVIGTVVLVIAILAVMGSIFFDEAFWSPQGFEDYASLEELITELIMMIIPIIIIIIVFSVIIGYFYMKGGDLLRFASRISGSPVIAQVDTAASLIYYSGLLLLIGGLTIIIVVGLLLVLISAILMIVGLIILGLEIRKWGFEFDTPGILLVVAAILYVPSMLLADVGVFVGLIGSILELVAYHMIRSALLRRMMFSGSTPVRPV